MTTFNYTLSHSCPWSCGFSSLTLVELATEREKALAMTVLAETTMVSTAAAMSWPKLLGRI